ncbi:MAG: signal peptidase I [Candidatus Sungbacteria bacterium]|uniref:Signal peptidase I n=1 Tax=Candidatus Sungiibacteriota bacterium TaxID=2750080 RepID=A0A9D6QYT3_9BACT|nr:signal peptidase I [Candidatus Sungbacteria bacterium]
MDEKEPEEAASNGKSVVREAWDFVKILIVAVVIVIPIRYFVAQPFIVKGASMEPNFQESNYLIIDELSYHLHAPARGDVVVFKFPLDESQYFIKRVIGLPGETVTIAGGKVFITEPGSRVPKELGEPYLPKGLSTISDLTSITLGPDQYFVMGDNRTFSLDSRKWGVLPGDLITGRAALRAWPVSEAGLVHTPAY